MLITRPFDSAALKLHPFSCGEPELDTWLARYAGQSEKKDNVRTTLLLDEQQGRIAAYYSMRTFELSAADGASATGRSRRYPVPAMLIARLAVDVDYQGHGAGRLPQRTSVRRSPLWNQVEPYAPRTYDDSTRVHHAAPQRPPARATEHDLERHRHRE